LEVPGKTGHWQRCATRHHWAGTARYSHDLVHKNGGDSKEKW
jgi:hypothetical protein